MLSASFKLLLPVYLLSFFSFLILFSINIRLFWQQFIWVALGTAIIIFFWRFDLRGLLRNREALFFFYLFSVLLTAVPFLFAPVRGVHAWIPLGPFYLQPVELVKVALILLYAYFFAKRHIAIVHLRTIAIPFFIFLLPSLIVLKQPDLGSVLILFGMFISFLLLSGLRLRHFIIGLFSILISSFFLWGALADYQQERILGVFYPERDPLGSGYNVIQSKIAIGSAGFFGKGFQQGTQVQLGFLPEASTDFVLPGFIEEWGLLGGFLVITAFFWLCQKIISIGLNIATNNFDRFICLGTLIVFILHFIINTGSATGLLPVIGLPFPFLSYGGSNLLTSFLLIAIINSIALRS